MRVTHMRRHMSTRRGWIRDEHRTEETQQNRRRLDGRPSDRPLPRLYCLPLCYHSRPAVRWNQTPFWTLSCVGVPARATHRAGKRDGDAQVLRGDLNGYDHTSHHTSHRCSVRRRLLRPRTLVLNNAVHVLSDCPLAENFRAVYRKLADCGQPNSRTTPEHAGKSNQIRRTTRGRSRR